MIIGIEQILYHYAPPASFFCLPNRAAGYHHILRQISGHNKWACLSFVSVDQIYLSILRSNIRTQKNSLSFVSQSFCRPNIFKHILDHIKVKYQDTKKCLSSVSQSLCRPLTEHLLLSAPATHQHTCTRSMYQLYYTSLYWTMLRSMYQIY